MWSGKIRRHLTSRLRFLEKNQEQASARGSIQASAAYTKIIDPNIAATTFNVPLSCWQSARGQAVVSGLGRALRSEASSGNLSDVIPCGDACLTRKQLLPSPGATLK